MGLLPNVGTLPLGKPSDDMAKTRFSLAQTAFIAKKTLNIKYYSLTTCAEATSSIATPTYASIAE